MSTSTIIELIVKAVIGLAIVAVYCYCVTTDIPVPAGLDRVLLIVLGGYYVGDVITDILHKHSNGE